MEKVKVYVELSAFHTDPIQYKPYSPSFGSIVDAPVYVEIEIDAKHVIGVGRQKPPDDGIILSADGVAELMGEVAISIRKRLEGDKN